MREPETDDFSAFSGAEHMFFALKDPFGMIRQETEAGLRRQVPDCVLERIETFGEPKFLTLGRKTQDLSRGDRVLRRHGSAVAPRDPCYDRLSWSRRPSPLNARAVSRMATELRDHHGERVR